MRKFFASLALIVFPLSSIAGCPKHAFTDSSQVRLTGDSVMIVTHASSNDDARFSSKLGVDEAVRFAKSNRIPVIYLQDDRPEQNYFMEDCNPDYWVHSEGGEVRFDITPSHVYAVGGHLEECLSQTLHDVLLSWANKPGRNLTVTLFMDGIFSNGKRIEESDSYYGDYLRFMGIVTYGRPAGELFPKLTLLETMGVILGLPRQYEYLERVLPHYERTLPDYRVEMIVDGSRRKVLQPGRGSRPPVLRFEFFDSASTAWMPRIFPNNQD